MLEHDTTHKPRDPGRITNLLSALCCAFVLLLWVLFLAGMGGRLQP